MITQETMGSAHNMFGSVHAVHMAVDDAPQINLRGGEEGECEACSLTEGDDGRLRFGSFVIQDIVRGETVEEVLGHANHQVCQTCAA
jgi:hypothetical protein